jgi:VWFA-related protein
MFTHWHTRLILRTLLVLPCALVASNTGDPSDLPTFRSTVSEIRVTFFAVDESHHPVTTLTKSDFAVVDGERIVRDFRSFTRSDENALDVVALVDLSESVAPRFRDAINDVLQMVAREQSIPDDNIAVLSFGGTRGGMQPAVLCSSGCGASDSTSRLLAVKSGGMTALFDALVFSSDFISHRRRAGVRTALILFSDGNDTSSLHTPREAMQAVLASEALVYSIDIGGPQNDFSGSGHLRQISDATGGRYFSLGSSHHDRAATVLTAVFEDLRASYVVTYDLPSRQAGFHSLRLLPTRNLNLTFHSRNGYYYEPSVR